MKYHISKFEMKSQTIASNLYFRDPPSGKKKIKRKIFVPDWVAFSKISKSRLQEDCNLTSLLDVPLRYDVFEKPVLPSHLQGVSMFRVHQCQCQTSRIIPDVHGQMQIACAALGEFLVSLKSNYDDYWGKVGVPKHLQSFYQDLACALNIPYLLKHKPLDEQKDAFCRLAESWLIDWFYWRLTCQSGSKRCYTWTPWSPVFF